MVGAHDRLLATFMSFYMENKIYVRMEREESELVNNPSVERRAKPAVG